MTFQESLIAKFLPENSAFASWRLSYLSALGADGVGGGSLGGVSLAAPLWTRFLRNQELAVAILKEHLFPKGELPPSNNCITFRTLCYVCDRTHKSTGFKNARIN